MFRTVAEHVAEAISIYGRHECPEMAELGSPASFEVR
jgi:hypothetical protein